MKARQISAVILDEGGWVPEFKMPLLTRFKPDLLLVVGDHLQLPPFTDCSDFIPTSVLERMAKSLPASNPIPILKTQYRMHPDICSLVSGHFYGGKLQTAVETARIRRLASTQPIQWYSHASGEERDETSKSLVNREECRIVCDRILPGLEGEIAAGKSVAVITFYKAQFLLLKGMLEEKGLLGASVSVMTVDASQGSEADIVILTTGDKSLHLPFVVEIVVEIVVECVVNKSAVADVIGWGQ